MSVYLTASILPLVGHYWELSDLIWCSLESSESLRTGCSVCAVEFLALTCLVVWLDVAISSFSMYGSRSLRSASDTRIFRVPRVCRRTLGERSFQYIGPVIWNSLSFSVRHATTLSSFKSKLKTHLVSSAYWFLASFLLFPSNPRLLCLCFFCDVCVCVGGWGVCGWVCVCGSGMLICFVSALGSHEMGRHKLPIIILL